MCLFLFRKPLKKSDLYFSVQQEKRRVGKRRFSRLFLGVGKRNTGLVHIAVKTKNERYYLTIKVNYRDITWN